MFMKVEAKKQLIALPVYYIKKEAMFLNFQRKDLVQSSQRTSQKDNQALEYTAQGDYTIASAINF